MGKGIDLARLDAPEHAAAIDNLKDQLLLVLVDRLGGSVDIPVTEIDAAGGFIMSMSVDPTTRMFHLELQRKQ
jgi:hypothetical protein